jgi:hypothetical protein
MNTKEMIAQLQRQRASIDKAIAALQELDGQPALSKSTPATTKNVGRAKGSLTEEGRERLRAAMKARWAVKKRASTKK